MQERQGISGDHAIPGRHTLAIGKGQVRWKSGTRLNRSMEGQGEDEDFVTMGGSIREQAELSQMRVVRGDKI